METRFTRARGEQGMALIAVILLLMLASGICAALAVSGRTETMAAYNVDTSVQAREAAQAGLTAGIEVVLTYLNGSGSITSLLAGPDNNLAATADNGSLASYGLPAPGATAQLGSLTGVRYSVRVMDEEDTERAITWTSAMLTNIEENGSATSDANDKIVIRATGTGRGNTSVTLESILYLPEFPGGIITEGDLNIAGSVSIEGDQGSVHSNSDLSFNGSPDVEHDATCSGTLDTGSADIGGTAAGGTDPVDIPDFQAADFLSLANWRLMSDSTVRNSAGTVVCTAVPANNCSATYGFTKTADGWDPSGTTNGVYYIQGDVSFDHVTLTGTTLIATGSMHIGANGRLTSAATTVPSLSNLLLVMDGDLEMSGNSDLMGGAILIRGQFDFGGNHTIAGQVISKGYDDVGVVTSNDVHGNSTFTYDGGGYQVKSYGVGSWREVK
jgi:hypothetical protein